MSPTSELHPEDMLDAARRGTLPATAQADLDAHLRRCPACRMQMAMTADFAAAEAAALRPERADAGMLARMVLAAARAPAPPTRASSPGRLLGRRLAFAALFLAIGSGVASAMWSLHARSKRATVAPVPEAKRSGKTSRPGISQGPEPQQAPEPTPLPAEAPLAPAIPKVQARAAARHGSPAAGGGADRHAPELLPPGEATARSAGELFAKANRSRRAGDESAALTLYRELQDAFPESREALTSRVIVGQLGLDQGNPAAALLSFRSYLSLSPAGTLAEEARWGCAEALMRLHRPAEEVKAWQDLLARHPASVHVPRARARLGELRGLH
jgi:hypothetical protein